MTSTTARYVATVLARPIRLKARHYKGLPPGLGHGERERMPSPALLVIEEESDGASLIRLSSEGKFAGDTWHPTVAEAKEQGQCEFGNALSDWRLVPADVDDVFKFATSKN